MRVFAGPNGSGKTTIIKNLETKIKFGVYVNADDIEHTLRNTNKILFDDYQLDILEEELQRFFRESTFAPYKRTQPDLWTKLLVKDNVLQINTEIDSYLAADLAEFLRQSLLENGLTFTYETVMSHKSKIHFLRQAKKSGYKIYLYFIATEDPQINISRVNVRVAQSGHSVPSETINERYYKSLNQLKEAVKETDRAYIFDNSGTASMLIAEVTDGKTVKIVDPEMIPLWFVTYLVENNN